MKKTISNHLLNLLVACFCLSLVLGCKTISDLGQKGREDVKETPVTTTKNPFVGTWRGKAFDRVTDLEMIFTETDWTLISGGKTVMTRPYKLKGTNSVEITTNEGTILPMTVTLNGDTLSVSTENGKTDLYRK